MKRNLRIESNKHLCYTSINSGKNICIDENGLSIGPDAEGRYNEINAVTALDFPKKFALNVTREAITIKFEEI